MSEPLAEPSRDQSPRATDPWALGTFLFAALYWLIDLVVMRAGTPHPLDDTWEYALVARALLDGDGMRTPMIHPPLWAMRDALGTVPVLIHGPLLPLLTVPLVALFGWVAPDHACWIAAIFAVFAAVLIQRLGAARFTPAVGAAAGGLFTLSPLVLTAVNHDVALVVGAALFAAALLLLVGRVPRPFSSGVALGLTYLARPEMLLAAPFFAIGARGAWYRLLAGFVIVAAPWWTHLALATGQPFFNLSSYMMIGHWARAELTPLRDFMLTPARWPAVFRETLPALPAKWADLFPHAVKRALLAPTGATGWLAVLGLAFAFFSRERHRLAAFVIPLAAIPVLVQTLTLYDSRYLVPFLPLWTLAVAFAAQQIAARVPWLSRPRAWIALLALLAVPAAAPAMRDAATEARALRQRLEAERRQLAPRAVEHDVRGRTSPMFSDTPDFVAWTTNRVVLWLERPEYERLPGPGDANPGALPLRGRGADTWFKSDTLLSSPGPTSLD